MAERDVHVLPDPEGGWQVKLEGTAEPIGRYPVKDQALEAGRIIARETRVELVEHGRDGRIQSKDSHGHDPRDVQG